MLTFTPSLGHAVTHFGRLTLTSHDYATFEPDSPYDDSETYNLHIASDRKALLFRHGQYAEDLVSYWKHESENDGAEQREAAAEMWRDFHNSRGAV